MANAQWTRQYLAGRARGYHRGTITIKGVAGAVRLALKNGLPLSEVEQVLDTFGLRWDVATQRVVSQRRYKPPDLI